MVVIMNAKKYRKKQKTKNKNKKTKKKLSKMKVFRNILLDNHYNKTDQRLKLLRTQLEGIPLNKSFPLQTEQQELELK